MKYKFLRLIALVTILAVHGSPSYGDPIRWNQEGWKTDFSITSIDLAKVLDGGPRAMVFRQLMIPNLSRKRK